MIHAIPFFYADFERVGPTQDRAMLALASRQQEANMNKYRAGTGRNEHQAGHILQAK
jgi:hypothetical protein